MRKSNYLEIARNLSLKVGKSLAKKFPRSIAKKGKGDYKWDLDEKAKRIAVDYLKSISQRYDLEFYVITETSGKNKIKKACEKVDAIVLMDEVEGTKNYANDKRYTSVCIINPENPSLSGVVASSIYRWDGMEYYGTCSSSWVKDWKTGEKTKIKSALKIDEMDSRVKIRGCFISKYLEMWNVLGEEINKKFDLEEKKMPTFCSDGTTTGDLLATIFDKSIVFEPRALAKNSERAPFPHDIFPAAFLAKNAGVEIYRLEPWMEDKRYFPLEEKRVAFAAIPPGKAKKKIKEVIEEAVKKLVQ